MQTLIISPIYTGKPETKYTEHTNKTSLIMVLSSKKDAINFKHDHPHGIDSMNKPSNKLQKKNLEYNNVS